MFDWIYKKLVQIRDKKKHEVLKLEWEKAKLERKISQMKNQQNQQKQ